MDFIKITESENYDGDRVRQAIVEYEGVKYKSGSRSCWSPKYCQQIQKMQT